jgi:hypothetical protein
MKEAGKRFPSTSTNEARPSWWRQLWFNQRRAFRDALCELTEVRALIPLLMKVRNGGTWTTEEKKHLLANLRRLSYLSPYFLLLLLPGSVFLLPLYAWWLDKRREKRF